MVRGGRIRSRVSDACGYDRRMSARAAELFVRLLPSAVGSADERQYTTSFLLNGSVAVEPGDSVSAGDRLGLCGNSGNTSEPHLHFHVQDKPRFGQGNGKPAFFNDYLADGEFVERGEPTRGQSVQHRSSD